ncbi:MAG: hypothetical protein IJZ64_03395 [Ruminococcus sp.]|nr:hypothetical protein [Ruminococcus sp.]
MRKILVTYTVDIASVGLVKGRKSFDISEAGAINIIMAEKNNCPTPPYIMTSIKKAISSIVILQGYIFKEIESVKVID